MYRYMLSYTSPEAQGFKNGNCEVTLPLPIRTMDDVNTVTKMLKEHFGLSSPLLLGFSRFEDIPPARQAS
ncbi:hypothetical protein FB565_001529 [Actinoplanes lutulentus]|uniref:Uncharacterized protein n=1 Tax=Actinoplanes lutulentus TaxID=1287878 RepID=A0A327ZFK4_9ACTN|nr:hypothetical protein [Actinoplanes lutulentus]MBB2941825.1 hypothetical protein [Actinoplanes lutulentus]RAK39744.1 hypothetical protein B0I29_104282 [Actinoplanes lutulentus]